VLYVRGNIEALRQKKSVACVGSRAIREPYSGLHRKFSEAAVSDGFAIVSGFALGADSIGHRFVAEHGGLTICVMPCGLDRPFPPENKDLWDQLLQAGRAVFISEFPFGMRASSLTLKKRNKMITALALGVLVSQSSAAGGAMNAYRFARDQKKPVATFSHDGKPDTSGNKLITDEPLTGDQVFPAATNTRMYKQWLEKLCF